MHQAMNITTDAKDAIHHAFAEAKDGEELLVVVDSIDFYRSKQTRELTEVHGVMFLIVSGKITGNTPKHWFDRVCRGRANRAMMWNLMRLELIFPSVDDLKLYSILHASCSF